MKRVLMGASAVLAAATMPFSGVSAVSSVDYEKSIGQINGADTINWVVEATSDGGYVVGGQTVACFKRPYIGEFNAQAASSGTIAASDIPIENATVASYEECVEYYQNNPDAEFWNFKQSNGGLRGLNDGSKPAVSNSEFDNKISDSFLARACDFVGATGSAAGGLNIAGGTSDDESGYEYLASCVDYIAKFKTDGTKEWLTPFYDSDRPVAVKKLSGEYRLLTNVGTIYDFSTGGAEGSRTSIEAEERPWLRQAYINDDGSMVTEESGKIIAYDANGVKKKETPTSEGSMSVYYYNLLPAGNGYVAERQLFNNDASSNGVVDLSKDLLTVRERSLNGVDTNVYLLSANKYGDVIVAAGDMDSPIVASFDKDGKKLGQYDGDTTGVNLLYVQPYKDFTVGLAEEAISMIIARPVAVVTMISFNRDMSVKYEYNGTGNEFVADVAELTDGSLAGVGLAVKGSTAINVDGDVNGGYMRLTGSGSQKPEQSSSQTKPTSRPSVKNPKTLDNIQVVATVGGVVLLGLGVILRKTLMRR